MANFELISKSNTPEELENIILISQFKFKPISREHWFEYINNHPDFFWYIDAPLGQLHIKSGLDHNLYYARAYYDYDPKQGYSDTVVEFPINSQYIDFQYPKVTVRRLQMMWNMAEALDCYLTKGYKKIITKEKFEKLIERYTPKKRGAKRGS